MRLVPTTRLRSSRSISFPRISFLSIQILLGHARAHRALCRPPIFLVPTKPGHALISPQRTLRMKNLRSGERIFHPHVLTALILLYRTPSTSASASPVLTRASSDGPPTTPTDGHPSLPFTLASFSPHLTPYATGHAYSFLREMDTDTDDIGNHLSLGETKDVAAAHALDMGVYLDLDDIF